MYMQEEVEDVVAYRIAHLVFVSMKDLSLVQNDVLLYSLCG